MEEERVEVRTRPRPPLPESQQRAVDEFWRRRQEEIEATVDFKERMLPMARLKKVIRAEDDGMMISADTPAFLAKLCELFVQELAVRAWACAESHNRRIILDSDIAEAVTSTESYDFLLPVLLGHLHEAAHCGRATRATPPATDRLVTRKRRRPNPDQRRGRIPPRVLPVTPAPPAPSSVRYVPFPFPCVLGEGATPSEDELMLPAPAINYTTRDCVFFSSSNSIADTFTGESSAAEMVKSSPLAGPAGELLPNVPPAAYYLSPYPVTVDSDEVFAVGNTDPSGNIGIPAENAYDNGYGALGIADAGQQEKLGEIVDGHGESVVMQQSSDAHAVQDAVAGFLGGTYNESSMYMLLEEVLVDEDLMFPDADLFPLVGAPPDSEDFIVDQHVLDDVFADPSSSTSSN